MKSWNPEKYYRVTRAGNMVSLGRKATKRRRYRDEGRLREYRNRVVPVRKHEPRKGLFSRFVAFLLGLTGGKVFKPTAWRSPMEFYKPF